MEAIQKWPIGIKEKFTHITELLKKYGPQEVGMPFVWPMKDKLFEIRVKGKEGIGRAFFCMIHNKEIIILHSIIKKTQKTPKKDLYIARKRLKEVEEHEQ